jgi:hypothetical protein
MPYKVICSNHILEVYYFENDPMRPPERETEDEYGDYFLTGNEEDLAFERPEWLKECNRLDARRSNQRRSKNGLRRLILANFSEGTNFITLTYAENQTDIHAASRDFDVFMKRLRRSYGTEFKYVVIIEFQKRGAIHFHMLADLGLTWKNERMCKQMEVDFAQRFWSDKDGNEHGFADLKVIKPKTGKLGDLEPDSKRSTDNIAAYVSKYMMKNFNDRRLDGKKAYHGSGNLDRPITYRGEEAEAIIQIYQLGQKKETFANCYESEYLGKITYKEYNLKRTDSETLEFKDRNNEPYTVNIVV